MAKKLSAIVLAAALSLSLLTGCGGGSTDTAASAPAETKGTEGSAAAAEERNGELIPVTFSRAQDSLMETDIFARMEGATYEDNLWTDLIAEKLGYDVKYLWIASSAELQTQKFNAAMAAGTIPDIVCVNKTDLKQLVEAGLVVDMKPYFDEYASDFVKLNELTQEKEAAEQQLEEKMERWMYLEDLAARIERGEEN